MHVLKRDFLKLAVGVTAAPLLGQRRPRILPKLGILTRYTEKNIQFAADIGCESLQLTAMPGTTLDITKVSADEGAQIVRKAASLGMVVSAYNCSFNHLDPDPQIRENNQAYFRKLIEYCEQTGVKVIGAQTGMVRDAKIETNLDEIKRVFTPYLELAEKHKVHIALENFPGQNLATTPENYERIFETLPSPWLGLEYDPSHFVRQFIDPVAPARQFGSRIHHVHAKDTEIMKPILQKRGIHGQGWWRYRLPGYGRVNWAELITALLDANYAGGIDVEHEDRFFNSGERGPEINDGQKQGYRLGLRYLSQFIPGKA